jgi:hypothetical protein
MFVLLPSWLLESKELSLYVCKPVAARHGIISLNQQHHALIAMITS